MKLTLNLVPYGYELSFEDGSFICRDFGDSYDDETKLKLAAQVAIANMFEKLFEESVDKVYKFLQETA